MPNERLPDAFLRLGTGVAEPPLYAAPERHTLADAAGRGSRGTPEEHELKKSLVVMIVVGVLLLLAGGCTVSTYNSLVALDQETQAQWAQVENAYQRRLDLVPNLVETVKGAAKFERETLKEVVDARAKALQAAPPGGVPAPQALESYQQAQDQLGAALSRLLVIVERYPELKATQNFRDLQAQLEGTENRIAVERMRFNEAAKRFNAKRQSFPTVLLAGLFGERFREKTYFTATPGAERAPEVKF
jgi:LemA protein